MKLKFASLLLFATCLATTASAEANDDYGVSGDYLASRSAGRLHDTAAAADFTARALVKDKYNPGLIERLFQYQLALGNIDKAETAAGAANAAPGAELVAVGAAHRLQPLPPPAADRSTRWQQFAALTRFDMRLVFKSPGTRRLWAVKCGTRHALAEDPCLEHRLG